ncbi:MAG: hypothetical protein KJZ93_01520 [Caldilineaceae bacterium]|nr:hypothetical protein [Caldilineaceae bacterium]
MITDHDKPERSQDPANYNLKVGGKRPVNAFYTALVLQPDGPVLQLACGSGLTTA